MVISMPINPGKYLKEMFNEVGASVREGIAGVAGYKEASDRAEDISSSEFDLDSQYLGEGDAMRHIVFSALATRKYGGEGIPKTLSWLNENVKGAFASDEDKEMDLFNDTLGRKIGLEAKDEEEVYMMARQHISSGKAKVVNKSKKQGDESTDEMEARISFEKMKSDVDNNVEFDPEGNNYDYKTAKANGLGPDGTGENKGHWGSVTQASDAEKKKYKLPNESYVILKGRKHETWDKAVKGETDRGFIVKKYGNRYYSVPADTDKSKK